MALAFLSVGAFAANHRPIKYLPKTTSGKPVHLTGKAQYDPHSMSQFKAQNHLSYAMNQKIQQASGKAPKNGFINGTIDTIPYFSSWFITGSRNSIYPYSMAGHSPSAGGATTVPTEIIPLISELDLAGIPVFVFDPSGVLVPPADQDSDANLLAESPLYDATTTYPGPPADTGQIVDTAQRVAFRATRKANWHVNLSEVFGPFIWEQFLEFNNGDWALLCCDSNGNNFPVFNINTISNNFEFILSFPGELAGTTNNIVPVILTDYLTAFENDDPNACCVLGFHSAQPGVFDPAGVLVWTWGTYIPHNIDQGVTNPFFGNFGSDTMVLSHEISELINDPFVQTTGTLVSPWVDGSVSFAQANLETGDVIEAMQPADVIYNVPLTTTTGPYTYTLQNTATLEWFTRNPFNGGIYSWPNEGSLSHAPHVPNSPVPNWTYGQGSAGFFFGPPF